jgi:LysM repeat protein
MKPKRFAILAALAWLSLLLVNCQARPELTTTPQPTATASPTPRLNVTLITRAPATAAVIQTTPSPQPSPTPTPTATPVVYLIEQGDTLLGLAIEYGVSLDDILSLNPGVQPQLLSIGQPVILPPPPTPAAIAPGRTAVPLQVEVVNLDHYRSPVGSLWLVGEVENRGPEPVEDIQLNLILVDDGGRALQSVNVWVLPGVIPAGGKGPFGLLLERPPDNVGSLQAAVIGGQTVVDLGNRYLDLAVSRGAVNIEDDQATVGGRLTNQGQSPAVDVLLVVTLYDAQNRVSGYQEMVLTGPLAPGAWVDFSLPVAPPGGRAVRAAFAALGLLAPA